MSATLCVFCGASPGADPRHADAARRLGQACAEAEVALVTGGGAIGLMGVVADAALAGGGRVTGIIPAFLQRREIAHTGLDETLVARDMHDRKRRMFARADAFVALPGGVGTLDEIVETLTWRTLGLHGKPVMLFGVDYWRPLLALLRHMTASGFLAREAAEACEATDDVAHILRATLDAAAERRAPA